MRYETCQVPPGGGGGAHEVPTRDEQRVALSLHAHFALQPLADLRNIIVGLVRVGAAVRYHAAGGLCASAGGCCR